MLALIPLRGGSKGIPKKNIKMIAGKPLCQWVIDAALEAQIFDKVIVCTDSEEIAGVVSNRNGTKVPVMMRPEHLALDDTPTEHVMRYVAEVEDFKYMCLIQATSPLTEASDFRAARAKFHAWGCDSMLTVTELKKFVWLPTSYEQLVYPLNYDPCNRPMREGVKPVYVETGNFYITTREILEKYSRLGGMVGRYLIDEEKAVDIDDMNDFAKAEFYLRGRLR